MRFPLAPLLALMSRPVDTPPVALLARRAGVHRKTVQRWARDGLTPIRADEVAMRAGWHPAEVRPDW